MNRPPESDPVSRRLAVVIPAWRARHLRSALASLRAQTDRRFHLYVGDDASPDDLRPIVEREAAGLGWTYHRFERNLGGRDLVGQWNRCLALTCGEPWIWLFSDDDEAAPGCVESIHTHLDQDPRGATLLRFDTEIIDEDGRLIKRPAPHPLRENGRDLLFAMLRGGGRHWCMPDHVLSRAALERAGGFVPFPRALHTDHATCVLLASQGHVRTLPGGKVRFRWHAEGTSSGRLGQHAEDMLRSLVAYGRFAIDHAPRIAPGRERQVMRLVRERLRRCVGMLAEARGDDRATARLCLKLAGEAGDWAAWPLRLAACRLLLNTTPVGRAYRGWRVRGATRPKP